MGATEDGKVTLLPKGKNIHDWPYWTQGQKDNEGYFTLSYYKRVGTRKFQPVLTANMNELSIKGKKNC